MGTLADNPAAIAAEPLPTLDERWELIQLVAASEQFSRSTRLHDFLLYVGKQSLKEGCREIHEQEIGTKVFGRPASYDRTADNIVRVNATELRKRIDSYFETAGASQPVIFEMPRGAYRLIFRRRPSHQPAPSAPVLALPVQEPPLIAHDPQRPTSPRSRILRHFALPVATVCFAALSALLYLQNRTLHQALDPWEGHPALAAFWSAFLDSHRQTDLVLPDDSASVAEDISRTPISLDDYISRTFVDHIQSGSLSTDRKQDVNEVLNHNLVTFGAVTAGQALLGEIPATYPHDLALARFFSAEQIKRDNVILIGGKKAVPWDYLFDDQLNFVTDFDYVHGVAVIRNRNPLPGELALYPASAASAVIAYLPNPSHTGNIILLAGSDSDATGSAAAFLTSDTHMQDLRNRFHADRYPYFEVLLKTTRFSGTSFDAQLVAFRTYPNLR